MPDVRENVKESEPSPESQGAASREREPEVDSYYYDDAHGYEDFDPQSAEEESE